MMTVDFINVGYGDAVLVRDGETDFSMLMDCGDVSVGHGGPGCERVTAAEFLRREGIDTLDLLVLTHLHRDHTGGLNELLEQAGIRRLWVNYLPDRRYWGQRIPVRSDFSAGGRCLLQSMDIYLSALARMDRDGTDICLLTGSGRQYPLTERLTAWTYMEQGEVLRRQEQIWQHVLDGVPVKEELDELDGFINNTSLRLRLQAGQDTLELPGDMYADCWQRHELSACTVMKMPHHGHKDGISPALLDMLRPAHVVISVSNTRQDDCPSVHALQLLRDRGIRVHVTDAVPLYGTPPAHHASVRFQF